MIKIQDLHKARKIYLQHELLDIEIDKENDLIKWYNKFNSSEFADKTQECLEQLNNYTIGDIVVDTPYNLGVTCALLLQNKGNAKCKNALKRYKVDIILE